MDAADWPNAFQINRIMTDGTHEQTHAHSLGGQQLQPLDRM
jgi:hypothetical protein